MLFHLGLLLVTAFAVSAAILTGSSQPLEAFSMLGLWVVAYITGVIMEKIR